MEIRNNNVLLLRLGLALTSGSCTGRRALLRFQLLEAGFADLGHSGRSGSPFKPVDSR